MSRLASICASPLKVSFKDYKSKNASWLSTKMSQIRSASELDIVWLVGLLSRLRCRERCQSTCPPYQEWKFAKKVYRYHSLGIPPVQCFLLATQFQMKRKSIFPTPLWETLAHHLYLLGLTGRRQFRIKRNPFKGYSEGGRDGGLHFLYIDLSTWLLWPSNLLTYLYLSTWLLWPSHLYISYNVTHTR